MFVNGRCGENEEIMVYVLKGNFIVGQICNKKGFWGVPRHPSSGHVKHSKRTPELVSAFNFADTLSHLVSSQLRVRVFNTGIDSFFT